MNAEKRAFLLRYRNIKSSIDRLQRKIDRIDERVGTIRTSDLSGMPRGGAGHNNYDSIDEKCDLEERIENLKVRGRQYRKEILEAIDNVEDVRHADVLESHCIDCLEFEDIAVQQGYSERHIRRLYSEAIDMIKL